jgi:hypothetical protein
MIAKRDRGTASAADFSDISATPITPPRRFIVDV